MTNSELLKKLETLVLSERKLTHQIIELIQLAESRKLYLEQGYGSLFDWLTKHFHYSAPAAYRRIQAARLLSSLPGQGVALREKLHSGSLTVSALSKVQSFIKAEEKRSGEKVSAVVKSEILGQIEHQSLQETEKLLFQSFPEAAQSLQAERVSPASEKEFRVSMTFTEEAFLELRRVQELLGHALPKASLADVISYLSKDFLKRKDPRKRGLLDQSISSQASRSGENVAEGLAEISAKSLAKKPAEKSDGSKKRDKITSRSVAVLHGGTRGEKKAPPSAVSSSPRSPTPQNPAPLRSTLSARVRRFVFQRDQGRCQYQSPFSGKLCGSRRQIEVDHVRPLALGGADTPENLRCLCRNHNQWRARRTFSSFP